MNKELSAKYEVLVNRAPELIKCLPWGKSFEVDVFRKPDFTALEVVSFATGGEYPESTVCVGNLLTIWRRYSRWYQRKLSVMVQIGISDFPAPMLTDSGT